MFDRKSIEIVNDRILYVSKHIKSRNHRPRKIQVRTDRNVNASVIAITQIRTPMMLLLMRNILEYLYFFYINCSHKGLFNHVS